MTMELIGFIGLGIMGKPMARNLIKAGNDLMVYDINIDPIIELEKDGAQAASSVMDLAKKMWNYNFNASRFSTKWRGHYWE